MTAPVAGIVRPSAPVRGASGCVVEVELDTREHRFLRDHLVDGRPLLSTVMGIEAIGCAALALRPGTTIAAMGDVRVGAPYFVSAAGAGRVEVTLSGDRLLKCTLRDPPGNNPDDVHFAADVTVADAPLTAPAARRAPPGAGKPGRTVDAPAIYDLFFHGESFRVVDSAWFDDEVFVGRLARDLPPIVDPARPSVMAPLLIELCLQSAGLCELALHGRMMIPHSIERIVRYTTADSATPGLTALVQPRVTNESAGGYEFDAAVVDEQGSVHLTVQGYRTTEFPHPHDVEAAARIRGALVVHWS